MKWLALVALLASKRAFGTEPRTLVCIQDEKSKLTCTDLGEFLKARDVARDAALEAIRIREYLAAQAAHGVYKL